MRILFDQGVPLPLQFTCSTVSGHSGLRERFSTVLHFRRSSANASSGVRPCSCNQHPTTRPVRPTPPQQCRKTAPSFPDATIDRQEDLTQISCRLRHAEIRDRKPIVCYGNVRTKGFLGKNRVVGNQFARFTQIDEMSNADVEEVVDLLTCFDGSLSPGYSPARNLCGTTQ